MKPDRQYLENKIFTASPQELLLLLFDGAIRFATTAGEKLQEQDYGAASPLLVRSQNILLELMATLKREDVGDEIFECVMSLYQFVHQRLMRANRHRDRSLVDEALKVLVHLRTSWSLSMDQDRAGRAAALETAQAIATSAPARPLDLEG